MRIPIPVAILIAILVVSTTWWLRTRKMDFMSPRGVDPSLPAFTIRLPDEETDTPPSPSNPDVDPTEPPPPPAQPAQPALDFGDLESAPGLAEYSEYSSKGAGYLVRLATELEAQGHFERALLAWERVIDTCTPTDAERATAEDAIVRIRPTLPAWNIDPEGDLPLLLQLGTSRPATDALKQGAQSAAEFLRRDSDQALLVTPRITSSGATGGAADAPIALYFTGTGEAEDNSTDLHSITPEGDDAERYGRDLLFGAYQLLRQSLLDAGGIVAPRPSSNQQDPKADFSRQVTRLHWKVFAQLLLQPPNQP